MADLDLDAIEARFGADVPARREHDPACQDVLALTAEVRSLRGQRARLDDLREEYRKREKSQDRIRERLTAERDTARAALADIRDRHGRHGDRCTSCDPVTNDACDSCMFPHPCWHRTTAERGLGAEEET